MYSCGRRQSEPATDQAAPAADQSKPARTRCSPRRDRTEPRLMPVAERQAAGKQAKGAAEQPKPEVHQPRLPSLPAPVTGNAVAVLQSHGATLLFSLMGMGAKKTWDAVTNAAFYLDPDWDQWYPSNRFPAPRAALMPPPSACVAASFFWGRGGGRPQSRNRRARRQHLRSLAPRLGLAERTCLYRRPIR